MYTLELESSINMEVAELETSTDIGVAELDSSISTNITLDTLKGLLSKDECKSLHVQTLAVAGKTSVIVYR